MEHRSLREQPYAAGPYETITIDLLGDGDARHVSLQLLEDGTSLRESAQSWEHPWPSCDRLFLFQRGDATVTSNKKQLQLTAGTLYLLPEGQPFTITYGAGSHLYWFHLRILDATKLPLFQHLQRMIDLTAPRLFNDLISAVDRGDRPVLLSRLLEYLMRLARKHAATRAAHGPQSGRFAPLFAYLDLHLSPNIRIDELAEIMDMSSGALSKAFQRSLGVPLKTYLQTLIMDRAKQALLYSDQTIEAIADDLGYKDPFYFSRAFKRHCACSPGKFRISNREPVPG